jgi:hypothetical protein
MLATFRTGRSSKEIICQSPHAVNERRLGREPEQKESKVSPACATGTRPLLQNLAARSCGVNEIANPVISDWNCRFPATGFPILIV